MEARERLQELVNEIYAEGKQLKPVFPYVLVRVLPKSTKIGMIVLPDSYNKPVHEAIVIDVYEPHKKHVSKFEMHKFTFIESSVKVGDHIMFQHFEGVPVPMDNYQGDFRLVADNPIGGGRNGILAVIEPGINIDEELLCTITCSEKSELLEHLKEDFFLYPKSAQSVTQSGGERK